MKNFNKISCNSLEEKHPHVYHHHQGNGSVHQSCHHYILIIRAMEVFISHAIITYFLIIRAKEVFFNHAIIISSLLGLWKCSSIMPSLYLHYQCYGSVLQSCHHYILIISAMEVFFSQPSLLYILIISAMEVFDSQNIIK